MHKKLTNLPPVMFNQVLFAPLTVTLLILAISIVI